MIRAPCIYRHVLVVLALDAWWVARIGRVVKPGHALFTATRGCSIVVPIDAIPPNDVRPRCSNRRSHIGALPESAFPLS